MAENKIVQRFEIDAGQALQTLGQLDKGFAELNKQFDKMDPRNVKHANDQIDRLGKSGKASIDEANKSLERFSLTFKGLVARVVAVQTIVRAYRQLRSTVAESVDSAIAFQTQLAEVQTIADGQLGTLEQVGAAVRRISDAYNVPLSDVAAGTYETLSANLATGADNLRFVETAANFARGSVTTLDKSVELLSGTLNAFGKDASQADQVASVFFKTIDAGNVTADQLVTSFNRTSALSAQLGVSFEEQAAAFVEMTRAGVKHNEAATRLNGILTALVKPTDAMSAALREMGFSNAETAISTLGLSGVLSGLEQSTSGSAESLARLFPNVRGLGGALSLTGSNAERFNKTLDELKGVSGDLNRQKALEVMATDANKVTAEFNKLKNALTDDVGNKLLGIAAGFIEVGVTADRVTSAVKLLSPVLTTGAGLLTAYAVAAKRGALANATFAKSFRAFSGTLLLGAAAAGVGDFIGEAIIENAGAAQKAFDEAERKRIEGIRRANEDALKVQSDANDKRLKEALSVVQELNKVYLKDIEAAEVHGKQLEKNAKRITSDILSSGSDAVEAFKRQAEDARKAVDDSLGRVGGLKGKKSDLAFEQSTKGVEDAVKVFKLTERAADLARDAASQLSRGDKGGLDAFARAQAAAKEAQSVADSTRDRALQARAANSLDSVLDKQIDAEKFFAQTEGKRGKGAAQFAKIQADILDNTREQVEIIRKNSSVFGEDGKLLSPEKLAAQKKAIEQALGNIKGFTPEQLLLADRAGFGQAAREIELELAKSKLQLQFDTISSIDKLKLDLQTSFDQFKLKLNFDIDGLANALGTGPLENPEEVSKALTDATNKVGELEKGFRDLGETQEDISRLRRGILDIANGSGDADRAIKRAIGTNTESVGELNQKVKDVAQAFRDVANSPEISQRDLLDLLDKVGEIKKLGSSGLFTKNAGLLVDTQEFSRALGLLQELRQKQLDAKNNPASQIGAKDQLTNLQTFVQRSEDIRRNFEQAARAAAATANPPSAKVINRAFGGAFFADGGSPRGLDTIPAMLSPGEFVVNAKSSRRFFSQLQAINAGHQPIFRGDGGAVDNSTHVGDVHVHAAASPEATAEAVIKRINRAQRRGTGRIK